MITFELMKGDVSIIVQIIRFDRVVRNRYLYDIFYNGQQRILSVGISCHEAIQRGEKFWRII